MSASAMQWLNDLYQWLRDFPWPRRPDGGHVVFLGFKEIGPMGNKLRGTLTFASIPAGYEKEIVGRNIRLFVNDVQVEEKSLAVGELVHQFEVQQDDHVRVEYRYLDDAGNLSDQPEVLDFLAKDTTPPPNPSDLTLVLEEIPGEPEPAPSEPENPPAVDPAPGDSAPPTDSTPPAPVDESPVDQPVSDPAPVGEAPAEPPVDSAPAEPAPTETAPADEAPLD